MLRVVATAVAAAALALATAAQNGTGGPYPDGARLYGISFSPFGLGSDVTCPPWVETPGDSFCLSATKARADLSIIRQYTKRIKTYSLFCEEATTAALQFARETGMTVILGIWITQDEAANNVELEKFSRVMAEYGDVVSEVMVGNEPVFILKVKEWRLAQYIWQVKGIVNALPADKRADGGVGTAEIYPAWVETCTVDTSVRNGFDMSAIVAASDWIGLNGHSFYGGSPADVAPYATMDGAAQVSALYGGKRLIITETGFPTGGPSFKPTSAPECPSSVTTTAIPGVKELETFMRKMEQLSRERGQAWYMFEPFDSRWKERWEAGNSVAGTDSNWGIATCDRVQKDLQLPDFGAL